MVGHAGGDRRRSLKTSELVARDLANYIIDNALPPGAKLPPEKEMVERFGVGRTTLREALRLLETRGVITIKAGPQGGPVVRRPRPDDLSEALALILQFEGLSLRDVIEARAAMEPSLVLLAAERIKEEELDQLDDTVTQILENLENNSVFQRENLKFHQLIGQIAGSVVLTVFTESLKSIWDGASVGVQYTPKRRKAVAEAHQRIVDALRSGDEAAAEAAMAEHLEEAASYWQNRYSDLVDRPVRWVG